MAFYYYGINRGEPVYQATVSTSTTGKEVEIVVNTAIADRQTVKNLLQNLDDFMIQKNYPPL